MKEVSCTACKPDWEEMGVSKFAFIPGAWEGSYRSPPRRKAKREIWRTFNLLLYESPDKKVSKTAKFSKAHVFCGTIKRKSTERRKQRLFHGQSVQKSTGKGVSLHWGSDAECLTSEER